MFREKKKDKNGGFKMGLLEKESANKERFAHDYVTRETKIDSVQEDTTDKEFEEIINPIKKCECKNLKKYIKCCSIIDERELWIAGYPNFNIGQNAVAANLFSGKKNLKIISCKGDKFYISRIRNESFITFKEFTKDDILEVEARVKLFFGSFKVTLNDSYTFSVEVCYNKDNINKLKELMS